MQVSPSREENLLGDALVPPKMSVGKFHSALGPVLNNSFASQSSCVTSDKPANSGES